MTIGWPRSLLGTDISRNDIWLPGVSGMLGYEWAVAPFVQMERDILRDIIFMLFLCCTVACDLRWVSFVGEEYVAAD